MAKSIERAVVIGASSGMGAAIAKRWVARGAKVALLARREEKLEKVAEAIAAGWGPGKTIIRRCDVTDTTAAAESFAEIVAELGGLDAICYAAGVMDTGLGEDEYSTEKDLPILETNLNGAVAWLNEAARLFTEQKHGTIVGIGSIAGDRGRRAYPSYHAAKAGFATFLESLRNRLGQHGVQVTTIKPGFIDTPMTRGMEGLFWLKTADEAASIIDRAVKRGRQTAYVPGRWRLVSLVIRSIPSFLFRKLSI
ncbi:MAG: short-chain dehydrogenase [Planctomycetota bacterium]|nr:MAG: short-chain dehydrogenase [Planctomycetota bacterium]